MKKIIFVIAMLVASSSAVLAQMKDHRYGEYSVYTNAFKNSYGELYGDCITVVFKDSEAIIMVLGSSRWNPCIFLMKSRVYREDGKNIKRWARGENMINESCDWWTLKYEPSKSTSNYAVYSMCMSIVTGGYVYFYFSKDGKKLVLEPKKDFNTPSNPDMNVFKRVTDESFLYQNNSSNNSARDKLKGGNTDGSIYE